MTENVLGKTSRSLGRLQFTSYWQSVIVSMWQLKPWKRQNCTMLHNSPIECMLADMCKCTMCVHFRKLCSVYAGHLHFLQNEIMFRNNSVLYFSLFCGYELFVALKTKAAYFANSISEARKETMSIVYLVMAEWWATGEREFKRT